MSKRLITVAVAVVATLAAAPTAAHAQSWGDRLKKRAEEAAKRATENRVDQKTTEATNAAMDKAEDTVKCAAGDKKCADDAAKAGKQVETTPAAGGGSGATAAKGAKGAKGAAASARPGEGVWANYDFKTGDVPLFVDDFANDEVGSFPRRLEFKGGSIDLVEWQGKRWISAPGSAEFEIPLPQKLPERFTVEFDFAGGGEGTTLAFDGKTTANDRANGVDVVVLGASSGEIRSNDRQAGTEYGVRTDEQPVHIALQVDGKYAKLYANERRLANVPNANLGRSNKIYVRIYGWSDNSPRMMSNFRVMAGGKKLYDALSASGRVATQGIYFDTGSDRIRPESSPTLKEIGTMLKEHPDLRLTIEGHTDNVGSAAANMTLSQQRAEAVKAALVSSYGVDADRLEAKGLGQTRPAAPNTSDEGRQQNRRVELVKM